MRSLWLAAALAAGVALGGWNLPQAQAGDGHGNGHNNHGHSQHGNHHGHHGHHGNYHGGHGHGHHGHGHHGYNGHYRSGYGSYGNVYYGGYAPYGGLQTGVRIYSSGYRGLGYSNFGVGPSLGVGIGGMYGAPFGGHRF